jgi:hypothetical protein
MNAFIGLLAGDSAGNVGDRSSRLGSLRSLLQNTPHGFAGLRAFGDPMVCALQVDLKIVVRFLRVIGPDVLKEPSVARAAPVGNNDPVNRDILGSDAA